MDKKKKHSIIWLVVIVVAILAIVLITIAGNNSQINTAYADEISENLTPNSMNITEGSFVGSGIESIFIDNYSDYEDLDNNGLRFNYNGELNGNAYIHFTLDIETNQEYTITIAYIGTPHFGQIEGIEYHFLQSGETNAQRTAKYGITEFSYTTTVNTNTFLIGYYINTTTNIQTNRWLQLLKLTVTNNQNQEIVNYNTSQYEYLKGQFDNSYSSGYESGITDGESLYRNNPFNGAALISATVIKDKYNITNVPLNLLSNGISFNSLCLAAEDHMYGKEEFEGEYGWTVTFSVIPFVFKQNQIYVNRSYGFASLIMTDINDKTYNVSWSDTLTKLGYALTESSAYGKTIKQIQITFTNTDDVGILQVGQTAAQDSAYQEGYNKGQSDGYQEGFSDAVTEGNGPMQSISKLISTVSAGLNVDLIGPISIGDILNVALGILLTFAVIRFFGGG